MSIIVLSKSGCPYCQNARTLLKAFDLPFNETIVDMTQKHKLFNQYKVNSFPIIIIGNTLIGGYSDLVVSYNNSTLQKICSNAGLNLKYTI